MPSPAQTAYARRSIRHDGQPITFTSWDRADNDPWGWVLGWHEDGFEVDGYALVHVAEPSRRVQAPVMFEQKAAA